MEIKKRCLKNAYLQECHAMYPVLGDLQGGVLVFGRGTESM